jgi:hypothetical protein
LRDVITRSIASLPPYPTRRHDPSASVTARHPSLKTSSVPAAAPAVNGDDRFSFS